MFDCKPRVCLPHVLPFLTPVAPSLSSGLPSLQQKFSFPVERRWEIRNRLPLGPGTVCAFISLCIYFHLCMYSISTLLFQMFFIYFQGRLQPIKTIRQRKSHLWVKTAVITKRRIKLTHGVIIKAHWCSSVFTHHSRYIMTEWDGAPERVKSKTLVPPWRMPCCWSPQHSFSH